jgi:tRNA (mo5U34)-methyltransferase
MPDKANDIRWFHQIQLPGLPLTPGVDASAQRLERISLPSSLAGKSVLDIGAWDGFFSFEAERRGAADVLATDSYAWSGEGWSDKSGFEFAHKTLGSRVRSMTIDVMELTPEAIGGQYDVVLFLGVLYHLKHPLLALERVAAVTREMLIIETELDNMLVPWPSMAFYPDRELNNDPTNWVGPNAMAVEGMLRAVGFRRIERVWQSSLPRRIARAAKMRLQGRHPFWRGLGRDRMTWRAYRSDGFQPSS